MDRLAGAVVGEGGVAVRGSSFLMGIFHLLYTMIGIFGNYAYNKE